MGTLGLGASGLRLGLGLGSFRAQGLVVFGLGPWGLGPGSLWLRGLGVRGLGGLGALWFRDWGHRDWNLGIGWKLGFRSLKELGAWGLGFGVWELGGAQVLAAYSFEFGVQSFGFGPCGLELGS